MSATITTTYAQVITALARRHNELAIDGDVLPSQYFAIKSELHAVADHAGISREVAEQELQDEIEAGPVVHQFTGV